MNSKTYRLIDRKHQVRNNARGTKQNDFKTPHCSFEFGQIPLETNTLSTKEYKSDQLFFKHIQQHKHSNNGLFDKYRNCELKSQKNSNVLTKLTSQIVVLSKRFNYWWKSNRSK